jgi:hypothetical protein
MQGALNKLAFLNNSFSIFIINFVRKSQAKRKNLTFQTGKLNFYFEGKLRKKLCSLVNMETKKKQKTYPENSLLYP